ncbi:aldo/keto reductase [Consotaella salsifontis]|uniref:Predicted oxidoreductase n=1 Tax=Consotaella salsifontis TaxID=1365950 RepID=A0A1T4TAG9_9HYPH|nr:aldo/keto reductase [Consotaella salsifontis]SKA37393.1 Predicted oxidoreductase [Consotaella salsifontis]
MQFRPLGRTGLRVSELCLGTMNFGGPTDEAAAGEIFAMARDAGINFVDTADVYSAGRSEEITGRLVGRNRHDWVLSSKSGNWLGKGENDGGLSRTWLLHALDGCLRRLGTDYLDVWYLHIDDRQTPFEEIVVTMDLAVRSGKVRHWGFSNFMGWQVAEFMRVADAMGCVRPSACQPCYNAFNRLIETDLLPACRRFGLGVVAFSPLARGVLTGKYLPDQEPEAGTRAARKDKRMMETEFRRESLALAQQLKAHAQGSGRTAGDFALRWVLNNTLISSVLIGPRTTGHLTAYLKSLETGFSEADEDFLTTLVASGHTSTPNYGDPRYPYTGRSPKVGSLPQARIRN